ncbi:MAG TPA: EAL domain-containing protein [Xanthobacteraceae bacterium]|nr:EAL domain-containing protein [Xanthobacteraceae bacterium]
MFRVLTCLTTEHDLRMVVLAGAVCFAASLAAVCLFDRALSTTKHIRAGWIVGAGAAAGCGIWATHFIGMLAYEPGVPVGYDVALTVLSLIAAVALTIAGLAVACATKSLWSAGAGGVIVGAGVAVMHYTGMAALEVPGHVTWSATLVTASIVFGILLAGASLTVAARRRGARMTLAAAVLLTLSIVLHHFTAMGAVAILPDPARTIDPLAVSGSVLAMTIAGVTLAILGAAIVAAVMDQRVAQKNALLDTALNNMTHGVMMFDADTRVILCNQRYLDLYRLPRGTIKPGLTLRDVIERRIAAGTFDGDPERYCATVLESVARREASRQIIEHRDGRSIEVVGQPLADGGWVATHQDITEERRRQASFRFLFENNPLPMWVWDHETLRFLAVNKAAEEKYGYDRETFLTLTLHDIRRSEDWSPIENAIGGDESGLREGQTTVHAKADGSLFDVAFYGRSMMYEGRTASLVTLIDITKRKRAEDELRRTRTFLDTIVENMPVALTVKDARDKRYVLANRAAEQSFGVPSAEMVGRRADEIFTKQTADFVERSDRDVAESGTLHAAEEQPFETLHNGMRLFNTKKLLVRGADSDAQYLLSLSEDVTDRKRARDQIAHMASHDALTDLPNRAAFNDRLAATLAAAAAGDKTFAVLSIDLDRFKEVTDVFGHATGDMLLCEIGRRLREAAGSAFLARFGGDEFALIVADGAQPATAEAIAERLSQAMAADIAAGEESLHVGLSIGIAVYPSDGADETTLIANADAALYRAKAAGRGTIRFFEAHMDERLRERRALQRELHAAIDNGELTLYYQPQARIGGETIGFEALVRWHHPVRGVVPPGTFIPLAEENNLIAEMGVWILREACREAASWPKPLTVAVNLSPVQFRHGDLPALVHAILLETGLAPRRLELEITEGVLINDFTRAVSILRRLKALGVSIAMDDFGTGYSSLSYLQSFPFDKIKIDRTFISNLTENRYSATIVRAVIGLGRGLHLPVLAEGVETAAQLEFLARESCDEAQGYHIGRPAPIAEYAEMVGRKAPPQLKIMSG